MQWVLLCRNPHAHVVVLRPRSPARCPLRCCAAADIPTIQYREGRLGKEFNQHWFTGRDQLLVVIPPECMVGSNKMVHY
jgi:hypothetical protein